MSWSHMNLLLIMNCFCVLPSKIHILSCVDSDEVPWSCDCFFQKMEAAVARNILYHVFMVVCYESLKILKNWQELDFSPLCLRMLRWVSLEFPSSSVIFVYFLLLSTSTYMGPQTPRLFVFEFLSFYMYGCTTISVLKLWQSPSFIRICSICVLKFIFQTLSKWVFQH